MTQPTKPLPCTVCGSPATPAGDARKALCHACMTKAGIAVDLLPLVSRSRGLAEKPRVTPPHRQYLYNLGGKANAR